MRCGLNGLNTGQWRSFDYVKQLNMKNEDCCCDLASEHFSRQAIGCNTPIEFTSKRLPTGAVGRELFDLVTFVVGLR